MAFYNNQPNAFWHFVHNFDPDDSAGCGVEHAVPRSGDRPDESTQDLPFRGHPGHRGRGEFHPDPWSGEWAGWFGMPEPGRGRGRHWGRGRGRDYHEPPTDNMNEQEFHAHDRGADADATATTPPPAAAAENHSDSPDTLPADADVPDPGEVTPEDSDERCYSPPPPPPGPGHHHPSPPPPPPPGPGHHQRGPGGRCRGGRRGFRWGSPPRHHHGRPRHHGPPPPFDFPWNHHHQHHRGPPPPPPAFEFPWEQVWAAQSDVGNFLSGLGEAFRNAQSSTFNGNNDPGMREAFRNAQPSTCTENDETLRPPVDVFNTPSAYVLHFALPGAKKEDIAVNWNPDTSVLNIAGVVTRPGDEEFLKTLTSGERKIGHFERNVTIPPVDATPKEDVDGLAITAKMEEGILVITVPKIEKEWTEIHKVDVD